ncbi:MAG: GNAT family N-acetyltransferase [Gemmatimonadetes bacterium]|nr:GNAT family N-acetyltransferase [Gemmatimonadota bacterium]
MKEATIRPFETLDELRDCVRLQEETWGVGFAERVPVSVLKIAERLGGIAAGAWEPDGRLVGFVFGLTGLEHGRPVHWSDMLAVRRGVRDAGLGRRLKEYQRERCLALGVRRCYWTFDPLEARNAFLNLGRLGAVVREYARDMYGRSDSPLHRGIGTDRFVALWRLDSERVARRLAGREGPPSSGTVRDLPQAFAVETRGDGLPVPGGVAVPDAPRFLVPVPASIQEVKARDPELAGAWRAATRAAMETPVARGWEVRELLRGRLWSSYLLVRTEDEEP